MYSLAQPQYVIKIDIETQKKTHSFKRFGQSLHQYDFPKSDGAYTGSISLKRFLKRDQGAFFSRSWDPVDLGYFDHADYEFGGSQAEFANL